MSALQIAAESLLVAWYASRLVGTEARGWNGFFLGGLSVLLLQHTVQYLK